MNRNATYHIFDDCLFYLDCILDNFLFYLDN